MKKKIKIGVSTRVGDILEDYEKAKACNFCTKFLGYGLHWMSGKCVPKNKEICYSEYESEAKECTEFDCEPDLLVEVDE